MTRSSSEFLVYACTSCGKRIFTDRHNAGRTGACPMCGQPHQIGARDPSVAADKGVERRRSRRAAARGARVGVKLGAAALHELKDLSATGVGFLVPGQPDPRQLQGSRPPPLRVGDVLQITLHLPESRERTLEATVRRLVRDGRGWLVGAQFLFASPDEQADLRQLLEHIRA